jgi:ApeA N-terminal domain 1
MLSYRNIQISIQKFDHTDEMYENESSYLGASVASHWFDIKTTDGSQILDQDADSFIEAFQYFLSFISGTIVGVGHIQGFDQSDALISLQLGVTRHAPMSKVHGWFDSQHSGLLSSLFPKFVEAYKDQDRNLTIRRSIEYYNLSNFNRNISSESALILSCSALETLCNYINSTTSKISTERAKNKKYNNFRDTATILNLKSDPSEHMTELINKITSMKWEDGYHAIKELRNSATHADKVEYNGREMHQAWVGAQWLFETIFLIWIGHCESYSDRRRKKWTGERHEIRELVEIPSPLSHP